MKRALISVTDKTGIVPFAKALIDLGYEIISTGGTKRVLDEAGLSTVSIDTVTGFPEILDGRVKTLHPKVHGGLLARRDLPEHMDTIAEHDISPIDMVVVNLYAFQKTIEKPEVTVKDAIENIDIGGPSMLRSAAKNYEAVTVIVDPADYDLVLDELKNTDTVSLATRQRLAGKVYRATAAYDSVIADYFSQLNNEEFPDVLTFAYAKQNSLRYGENPQQKAALYRLMCKPKLSLPDLEQLNGKELSYNNIQDTEAALTLIQSFSEPTAVALKHMNPCGVGTGIDIRTAFEHAFAADPISIFGGVVALNRPVDLKTAELLTPIFLEIILAPDFDADALDLLKTKKNLRVLKLDINLKNVGEKQISSVSGGILVQDKDAIVLEDEDWTVVTRCHPTKEEKHALLFNQKIVKGVKSNAIVIGNRSQTFGVGAGQMNRVGAAKIALEQAGEKAKGAVMASDAFFPMRDTVELAAKYGIKAIIQPGGSIRDADSIAVADKHGIAMVMTKTRHFKH